jgi:hypothetical protein
VFGRQRFFTIGPHGSPWTPEKARKEAKRLLGLVADGKDPADERAQAALRAADTPRRIADEYLKQAKQKQRPRTYSEIERYINRLETIAFGLGVPHSPSPCRGKAHRDGEGPGAGRGRRRPGGPFGHV